MIDSSEHSPFEGFLNRIAGGRVAILFAFHAIIFAAAYAFAYLVRFEFAVPPEYLAVFKTTLPVIVVAQLAVGIFYGFYRGWWRYVGMGDVIRLVFGLSTATAVLIALWYLGPVFNIDPRYCRPPRGVLLTDWAFALLTLFGTRVAIRVGRDRFRRDVTPSARKRVLIIGAGDAGETLAREIEHRPQLGMKVVGFVDDQRAKWNSLIRGIKVVGPISKVGTFADEAAADEALIAIPSASGKRMRDIIRQLSEADLTFKTIPGIDHLVTGRMTATQLRPVNVEDLLRRSRIDLLSDPVKTLFTGKRVLVTGAGGTIGSELASQILQLEPARLGLIEHSELALYEVRRRLERECKWAGADVSYNLCDIRQEDTLAEIVRRERPDIVLHAAAYKHVPLGEENPREYLRNNALATRSLAEICATAGVDRFVFISTDKAINPTSVMGASKRAAEILLLDLNEQTPMRITAVRFGNVIGSSGSVIPLFMEQIAAGGPVTVTHPDVTRYFIRVSEAISLVLQAATLSEGGQVFMLDMGEPIKIAELARDLIRLSNHTEDEISITFTGLRPGEKLFEEIRLEGESIFPTVHPQIVITQPPQPSAETTRTWLTYVRSTPPLTGEKAVDMIRLLVPEYEAEKSVRPLATIDETVGPIPAGVRMREPAADQ